MLKRGEIAGYPIYEVEDGINSNPIDKYNMPKGIFLPKEHLDLLMAIVGQHFKARGLWFEDRHEQQTTSQSTPLEIVQTEYDGDGLMDV